MNILIKPSDRKEKKYDAVIGGKKKISFGQKGASDMTQHKSEVRKKRYIDRHKARENWNDPKTAGFMSRWLLWNKPTLTESIRNINKRFPFVHVSLGR